MGAESLAPLTAEEVASMRAKANAPSHVKPIAVMAGDGLITILCDSHEALRATLTERTRELADVIGELQQRLQPTGSPPPGGSGNLARWIIWDARQRITRMEAFLEQSGYRRCDIAACNCESWHGGHANERLREISDSLQEAGLNGGTVHGGVLEFIRRAEAEKARADAAAQRVTALEQALAAFLAKLSEVEEATKGAFIIAHIHGCGYDGPNYGAEKDALLALLHAAGEAAPR